MIFLGAYLLLETTFCFKSEDRRKIYGKPDMPVMSKMQCEMNFVMSDFLSSLF